MYDGETKKVTLVCKNDLMNYIVDRFGDEVDTVPGDCGHFRAVAEVSVSQTFFAWVFQFNGDIRITAPEEVVLQYGEMLKMLCRHRLCRCSENEMGAKTPISF